MTPTEKILRLLSEHRLDGCSIATVAMCHRRPNKWAWWKLKEMQECGLVEEVEVRFGYPRRWRMTERAKMAVR